MHIRDMVSDLSVVSFKPWQGGLTGPSARSGREFVFIEQPGFSSRSLRPIVRVFCSSACVLFCKFDHFFIDHFFSILGNDAMSLVMRFR